MKRLIDHIVCRTGGGPVLVQAATLLSAKTIVSHVADVRANGDFPPSQRYRVYGQNDLELVLGLLAADGWASEIILAPEEGDAAIAAEDVPEFSVRQHGSAASDAALEPVPGNSCDTQWLLTTSGTTGSRKWVPHDLASLTRTTKTDDARGAGIRWGLLYDPRCFAGLQVVLQSLLGGSSLVLPSKRRDFVRTAQEFRRSRVNAISATPSQWRKLLLAGLADGLTPRIVTLGGEIADAAILKTLRRVFPSARISHIYASTEAGVGFAVSDGREGFPACYLQSPPRGIELKVDERGCLWIRSDSEVSQPDRAPADRKGKSRICSKLKCYADGTPLADANGWICTGDLIQERGERFYFMGRVTGTINVGGNKVHPREIEDVATAVPGVVLALARARHSPIVGQVPELLIEPEDDVDPMLIERIVLEHCRSELPRFKWPAVVKVVSELSLSETGKVARS